MRISLPTSHSRPIGETVRRRSRAAEVERLGIADIYLPGMSAASLLIESPNGRRPIDYPDVGPARIQDWFTPHPDYDPKPFTCPTILARPNFADAPVSNFAEHAYRWPSLLPYSIVDQAGRELNPMGRTNISGRGGLALYGANRCVDAVYFDVQGGSLHLLVGAKDARLVLPGGHQERDSSAVDNAIREGEQETGLLFPSDRALIVYRGFVASGMNTDIAWKESEGIAFLGGATGTVRGGDDVDDAFFMDVTPELLLRLSPTHRAIVRAALFQVDRAGDIAWHLREQIDVALTATQPPICHGAAPRMNLLATHPQPKESPPVQTWTQIPREQLERLRVTFPKAFTAKGESRPPILPWLARSGVASRGLSRTERSIRGLLGDSAETSPVHQLSSPDPQWYARYADLQPTLDALERTGPTGIPWYRGFAKPGYGVQQLLASLLYGSLLHTPAPWDFTNRFEHLGPYRTRDLRHDRELVAKKALKQLSEWGPQGYAEVMRRLTTREPVPLERRPEGVTATVFHLLPGCKTLRYAVTNGDAIRDRLDGHDDQPSCAFILRLHHHEPAGIVQSDSAPPFNYWVPGCLESDRITEAYIGVYEPGARGADVQWYHITLERAGSWITQIALKRAHATLTAPEARLHDDDYGQIHAGETLAIYSPHGATFTAGHAPSDFPAPIRTADTMICEFFGLTQHPLMIVP